MIAEVVVNHKSKAVDKVYDYAIKEELDVKIGGENKFKQLENSSVIMAHYNLDSDARGSIGIIGPTRIDYASLIPSVRYLTDLVGELLTQTLNED